jgi:hypothetical protein
MDYEQIMAALRNAHAAGDTEGARRLAQMAQQARQQPAAPRPEEAWMGDALAGMGFQPDQIAQVQNRQPIEEMTEIARGDGSVPHQMARAGFQGITFGGGDEITAGLESILSGADYGAELDRERGMLDEFREERPLLSMGSEIAGAVALPLGVLGQGKNLGLGMRSVLSALTGAGQGAAYGFLSGEDGAQNRAENAVAPMMWGAGIGALIPGATRLIAGADDASARNAAVREQFRNAPSADDVRAQSGALYDQIDNLDVNINAGAFDDWLGQTTQRLQSEGMDILPGTPLNPMASQAMLTGQKMVGEMSQDPSAAIPFSQLDQFRRRLGTAAGNMQNPADSRLGSIAIGELDDFVQRLGPDDISTGDISTLQDLIPKARELWAQASRAGLIDDAIDNSQNYLSNRASGLRNQFARILRSPQLRRGFSAEEIAAIRRVVDGTIPERLVHLLGGGIGQISQMGLGAALGSGAGALGAAVGTGAGALTSAVTQRASEGIALRNAEIVRALIASGGLRNLDVPRLSQGAQDVIETLLRNTSRAPMAMSAQ